VNYMSSTANTERTVDVKTSSRRMKVPKEKVDALKGVVGGKTLARMKREYVECPVTTTTRCFAECFTCANFVRRMKGKVYCAEHKA